MKLILATSLLCLSLSVLANEPCYGQMSNTAYLEYAKSEKIPLARAKENADLFVNSLKKTTTGYTYKVELAEQYVTDSESGYFPGTKFQIKLSKRCNVISAIKI